jgi:hypothetical protein
MTWVIEEVPWGDLWRTAVTTVLFTLLLGMPISVLTSLDSGTTGPRFVQAVALVSLVTTSIVVWSETIPWIGDS